MRMSDWSSDVCSSDLPAPPALLGLIIDIALRILPDAAAAPEGMELRAECRPIPPGEYALQESHARLAFSSIGAIGRFDRKSVGYGKSGAVRVELGDRRVLKQKTQTYSEHKKDH